MAKRLQVNPTRMQLMELRDRLSVAVHGHSLLKDKLEGLMAEFMDLVEEYKGIRAQFNGNYPDVTKLFVLAGIAGSREIVDDAIAQASSELDMTVSQRNVLSV
ncbi:MAG: V-type ATP synthase subunit D, partial [Planctomycetota bacterium]